jgi:polysaccharide export outer membrane protein
LKKFLNITCYLIGAMLLVSIYSCKVTTKTTKSKAKSTNNAKVIDSTKSKKTKKTITPKSSRKKIKDDFNYFQTGTDSTFTVPIRPLLIRASDLLSISISSKTNNQEQVAIFNMGNGSAVSTDKTTSPASSEKKSGASLTCEVDLDGYIQFPILGSIKVAEMTRSQLSEYLQKTISEKGLVKEPSVIVSFSQIHINVLGEVKAPGVKIFDTDRITLIDVLSAAGDLSEQGRRDNIQLIREENGRQKFISINLLDSRFMGGANFQMQQNDLIYVKANNFKLNDRDYDPKAQRDLQRLITITSFGILLFNIFFVLNK